MFDSYDFPLNCAKKRKFTKLQNVNHTAILRSGRVIKKVYNCRILIKKFPEFFQKILNAKLFIKINIVPFKVIFIHCTAFILEIFLILCLLYPPELLQGGNIFSRLLKHFHRIKKLQGATAGAFYDYRMVSVQCSILVTLCIRVLLWSKIHGLFAHKSFHFPRIVSRKHLILPKSFSLFTVRNE